MDTLTATVLRALLPIDGWDGLKDLVDDTTFSSPDARRLFAHIRSMREDTHADIPVNSLVLDIESTYMHKTELRTRLLDAIKEINEAPTLSDAQVKRHVRRFVSRSRCFQAAEYIASNAHDDAFDPSLPADLCQSAVDLWSVVDPSVRALDDFDPPDEGDDRPGISPFGLSPELDNILGGGVAKGELAVIIAPPGRGKTSYLIAAGAAAARAGKEVLHITLEVNERKVMRRYQQCWSRMTKDQMIANPSAVAYEMTKVRAAGGNVLIKDWSYEGVRVDDIFALVKRLRQKGHRIDTLVIDYLELVRADKSMMKRDPRFGMGQVVVDSRAMSVALDVPVLTAWQVNRAGSDKHIITALDLSECWDVYKHADIMFSLNQNDVQLDERIMRIYIIKQRESTTRTTVYLHSDLDRCDIRERPTEEEDDGTGDDDEGTTGVLPVEEQDGTG